METITLTLTETNDVVAALARTYWLLHRNMEHGIPGAEEDMKWVAGILQNLNVKTGNTTISWT